MNVTLIWHNIWEKNYSWNLPVGMHFCMVGLADFELLNHGPPIGIASPRYPDRPLHPLLFSQMGKNVALWKGIWKQNSYCLHFKCMSFVFKVIILMFYKPFRSSGNGTSCKLQ